MLQKALAGEVRNTVLSVTASTPPLAAEAAAASYSLTTAIRADAHTRGHPRASAAMLRSPLLRLRAHSYLKQQESTAIKGSLFQPFQNLCEPVWPSGETLG